MRIIDEMKPVSGSCEEKRAYLVKLCVMAGKITGQFKYYADLAEAAKQMSDLEIENITKGNGE